MTLPASKPHTGYPHGEPRTEPLDCRLRIAIARSIIDQRPPTPLTCDLAARALQGFDVVAEAGVL